MAIPKYNEMYRECLNILSDAQIHKISEIRNSLATAFHVSDEEQKELLPSGKQPIFNNRVNWTCTYLKQAGLIKNSSRGIYQITSLGKKVIFENPSQIDNNFLSKFDSFRKFTSDNKVAVFTPQVQHSSFSNQSPQDIFDAAYSQINTALIEEVLSEVMNQTPLFFEHLVVKLLTQMGYGSSLENAGTVTRASGDEGIDGIIREDKLGFDKIYIQAKRWDRTNTIGRPELQKFVGALAGQGANKGLFITTAEFTKEAKEYASKQHTTKIVLVDGITLAKLMIEYNIGVSIEATYAIKKIDSDFFDDNLN